MLKGKNLLEPMDLTLEELEELFETADDLIDMGAVLDTVVQLKHEFRRITQIQRSRQFFAQPTFG